MKVRNFFTFLLFLMAVASCSQEKKPASAPTPPPTVKFGYRVILKFSDYPYLASNQKIDTAMNIRLTTVKGDSFNKTFSFPPGTTAIEMGHEVVKALTSAVSIGTIFRLEKNQLDIGTDGEIVSCGASGDHVDLDIARVVLRPNGPTFDLPAAGDPAIPGNPDKSAEDYADPAAPIDLTKPPDLIVTDIQLNDTETGFVVYYTNAGKGVGAGDFLIKTRSRFGEFPGNENYRFKVPLPGKVLKTGGFTPGLIGIKPGMEEVITAEIDWENRVAESNEDNNDFRKQIKLPYLIPPK